MIERQHKHVKKGGAGLALAGQDCSDSERARYYGRISRLMNGAAPGEKILPGGGREPEAPGDGRHQAGAERPGL